jgi:hypothetical protein
MICFRLLTIFFYQVSLDVILTVIKQILWKLFISSQKFWNNEYINIYLKNNY